MCAATRPLSVKEVTTALLIQENYETYDDLEMPPDGFPKEYIKNLCGLFVSVIDERVFLLHQTAKEFLIGKELCNQSAFNLNSDEIWKNSITIQDSGLLLASRCMWFLQLEEFKGSFMKEEDIDQLVSKYEFFEYSAENWPVHYRAAVVPDGDHILHLAFKFCDVQADHHLSFMLAIGPNFKPRFSFDAFSSLHIASDLGLGTVVGQLLAANSVDVNAAEDSGRTPLFYAAARGYEAVVGQLLAAPGIKINVVNDENETPLFWAANEGHEGAVGRLLTGHGIAVNAASVDGWTPLLCAANKGHEGVVRQLLAHPGINVNAANRDNWTALFWAVFEGYEGIVRQLLAAPGIDVNTVDGDGETLLFYARDLGVTKLLKSRTNMVAER